MKSLKKCCIKPIIIISTILGIIFYLFSVDNIIIKQLINNEIIYLEMNNAKVISYNLLNINPVNNLYLLSRLYDFDKLKQPIMIQTILDNNYVKISNWEIINNFNFTLNDIIIEKENITTFKIITEKDFIYSKIMEIKSPDISKLYNYIIKKNHLTTYYSDYSEYIDIHCLLQLSIDASSLGVDMAKTGTCDDFSVVAFPGTNFKEIGDILSNIEGPLDDYLTALKRIKNFDYKHYNFCVGYSLGATIAKYLSLGNYCDNIITFGSLLTEKYNTNIPIIEYINAIDDDKGCCERTWYGGCKKNGMFLSDPVSLIVTGFHHNVKYIGNKNTNCIGSLSYTLWKTKFSLHDLDRYIHNLNL